MVLNKKNGRETVISVIYKKGVIVLFLLNCIFSRFFHQSGSKPYSSQDPSTFVPHAAIAHTPFSSAQNDGESLVTSHQSLVTAKQKEPRRVPWFFGYQESISFFLVRLACSKCMLLV